MINKQTLTRIIDDIERGRTILPGEVVILRDAVDLLSDLADTLDKVISDYDLRGYERETTQALKIVEQGPPVNRQADTKPARSSGDGGGRW